MHKCIIIGYRGWSGESIVTDSSDWCRGINTAKHCTAVWRINRASTWQWNLTQQLALISICVQLTIGHCRWEMCGRKHFRFHQKYGPHPQASPEDLRSCLSSEWLARLTVVWEDPGSNHAADSCVYRDGCCDIQSWARAVHLYCSA